MSTTAIAADTATERIAEALSEKLEESVPKITEASSRSGQPSSITLKIALKPDKELPDAWHVEITEKLALASAPIDATARIDRSGPKPQLSLMAYFEEE